MRKYPGELQKGSPLPIMGIYLKPRLQAYNESALLKQLYKTSL